MRVQTQNQPAEIRGKHVEGLVLGDDWMKGGPIGPIDHVTLICGPPIQRAARRENTWSSRLSLQMDSDCIRLL